MKHVVLVLFLILIKFGSAENTLVAVHFIFRHGDRTPDLEDFYNTNPYKNESYFKPYGFGQLTNTGKLRCYNLGKEVKQRYNGFLDDVYNPKLIKARCTDFSRTKESLQTMLSGLFPPTEELTWLPGFNWQPIAYDYVSLLLDKELHPYRCLNWFPSIDKYYATDEGINLRNKYRNIFEILSKNTQEEVNDLLWGYRWYHGFKILNEFNISLPEWTKEIYPNQLEKLVVDYYSLMTGSTHLRQMAAGYFVKNILSDTHDTISGKNPKRKIFIWCVHDSNIAALLRILKISNMYKEIPSYGSYVAMELHNINDTYGFKVFYKSNQSNPDLLKLPECENFCPIDKFKYLIESDIPEDESICRGGNSNGENLKISLNIIIYLYLIKIFI